MQHIHGFISYFNTTILINAAAVTASAADDDIDDDVGLASVVAVVFKKKLNIAMYRRLNNTRVKIDISVQAPL